MDTLLRPQVARFALLLCLVSCGGAPPPPPEEFHTQLKDTTADRCLETANVHRPKKDGEPQKISVRHILVKYAGAKRADASVKRTREQACLRALEAHEKLVQGTDFSALVKTYSEEPGAASRDGSLGSIERSAVAPPFADAAFELELNQASEVVETEFGFHVILRTE